MVKVKVDDKIVIDKEIDEGKWKSYHEINVKQNMGNGRHNGNTVKIW